MATIEAQPAPAPPAEPIVRMYISNLAPTLTDEEVREFVARHVRFRRLHVVRNMRHGLCARFAFLDLDPDQAVLLKQRVDGAEFFGRLLGVLLVKERPDRLGPDGV